MIDLVRVSQCVYNTLLSVNNGSIRYDYCEVVDYINRNITCPYIAIGDIDIDDNSIKDIEEIVATQYIHVYSNKKSKQEVLYIMNRINELLKEISSNDFQIHLMDTKQAITRESKTIGGVHGSYPNEFYYHGLIVCELLIINNN